VASVEQGPHGASGGASANGRASYKIIASGWPATSPMWPTLDEEQQQDEQETNSTTKSEKTVPNSVPFIYADEPRKIDHSLLLSLNATIIEMVKTAAQQGNTIGVNLSFEFYFNHDQLGEATPPAIKIEIDRKEFRFLKPASPVGGPQMESKPIRTKVWTKFNERIRLNDFSGLENADWLKFSLINRRALSLVAIRRLKIEFIAVPEGAKESLSPGGKPEPESGGPPQPAAAPNAPSTSGTPAPPTSNSPSVPRAGGAPAQPAQQPPPADSPPAGEGVAPAADVDVGPAESPGNFAPDEAASPETYEAQQTPGALPSTGGQRRAGGATSAGPASSAAAPAAQDPLASTIGPVAPRKSSWSKWIGQRRRRRKRELGANAEPERLVVALGCFEREACEHWRSTEPGDRIKWSLASMPPSIATIDRGYHFVSNRGGEYGEPASQLRLQLSETEQATRADRAWSHCMELALYVTGRSRLQLHRLERAPDASGWLLGERLLWWAPTVADGKTAAGALPGELGGGRAHLPGAQMGSLKQSGWTFETLCLEQFFANASECVSGGLGGASQCALAFSMAEQPAGQVASEQAASAPLSSHPAGGDAGADSGGRLAGAPEGETPLRMASGEQPDEQVVAVALLSEFASQAAPKPPARWLRTWQRPEVSPLDNWDYFPRSHFALGAHNVSLVSLFHGAHFAIQSDWLHADHQLALEAVLSIELGWRSIDSLASNSSTSGATSGAAPGEPSGQSGAPNEPKTSSGELQRQAAASETSASLSRASSINPLTNTDPEPPLWFRVHVHRKLVDANFRPVVQPDRKSAQEPSSLIDWPLMLTSSPTGSGALPGANWTAHVVHYNLSLPDLGAQLAEARRRGLLGADEEPPEGPTLLKLVIELELECLWQPPAGPKAPPGQQQQAIQQEEALAAEVAANGFFRFTLSNVSVSERCFPSPCQFGACSQNGTAPDDWECACDQAHRGRRCELGKWCDWPHVLPSTGLAASSAGQQRPASAGNALPGSLGGAGSGPHTLQQLGASGRAVGAPLGSSGQQVAASVLQPRGGQTAAAQLVTLGAGGHQKALNGSHFCQLKLGPGSRCNELDLPLSNETVPDEGRTFLCSCRPDHYLSDEAKCRKAHQCNSLVCPQLGQFCDETRPFQPEQPCQCNERLDWFPAKTFAGDPKDSPAGECVRGQCANRTRDCGFEAHLCVPTAPHERPICKCAPKFVLRREPKTGRQWCQSAACLLPTLNDCHQVCLPDNSNLERPFTCACHPGFQLDPKDGRSCRPLADSAQSPHCKPACEPASQICTRLGCKCKQGFVAFDELSVPLDAAERQRLQLAQLAGSGAGSGSVNGQMNGSLAAEYVKSVRCVNVCELIHTAEQEREPLQLLQAVCPFGLCDPDTFQCRCSDPKLLAHSKYEPALPAASSALNLAQTSSGQEKEVAEAEAALAGGSERARGSPLCRLKRVCEPQSAGHQLCAARGAICVPDFTRAAMFECVCPPGSERKLVAGGQTGDFVCEPRCSSIRHECLKKQAVCRPVDRDQVRCDCPPGMMMDPLEHKCFLAPFAYSLQLLLVNKYYEPAALSAAHFRPASGGPAANETGAEESPLLSAADSPARRPARSPNSSQRGSSVAHRMGQLHSLGVLGRCNISQVLPKSIIEDPYEHDMAAYLGYMEQCEERLGESSRAHQLNWRLADDLRQSLAQHLPAHHHFTVTTNHSLCAELAGSQVAALLESQPEAQQEVPGAPYAAPRQWGRLAEWVSMSFLNCTLFLQSSGPVEESALSHMLASCDPNGADPRLCWIKPRLLLLRAPSGLQAAGNGSGGAQAGSENGGGNGNRSWSGQRVNFRQIVACEMEGFCGPDAHSVRLDEHSSLCSCKCPPELDLLDLKELRPPERGPSTSGQLPSVSSSSSSVAVKEVCAPRNRCQANGSAFCEHKPGSRCQYDVRAGSHCVCQYPAYEDNQGRCVEVAFSPLDSSLIVLTIIIGTCLLVSLAVNLYALLKVRRRGLSLFGQSKQYPMHEFASANAATTNNSMAARQRPLNRSTGMPNLAFNDDDDD